MRLRRLAVLLLFAGSSVMACRMSAQKPLRMTIDELFRRVEQSNVEVKAAQKDVNISRQLEKNARAKATARHRSGSWSKLSGGCNNSGA